MMKTLPKQVSRVLVYAIFSAFTAAALISMIMHQDDWLSGMLVTAGFLLAGILGLYFLCNKHDVPRLVCWLVGIAFILRLFIGAGLMAALPVVGQPTDQQRAGYVFQDAYQRDTQAQKLAASDKPISSVFTKKYATDQYGGYLGLSIFVYRYLSPGVPRPQLLLILSAWMGAAAVLYFWMFARRILGEVPANWGAWLFSLYPQSVLLGATHMREPFLIFFVTLTLWAAGEWMVTHKGRLFWWMGLAAIGFLLISPGILFPLYAFILIWWISEPHTRRIPFWGYLVMAGGGLAVALVFAYGIGSEAQLNRFSTMQVIMNWFKNSMSWDIFLAMKSSGRLEYLFADLPEQIQVPFIIAYGVLQPVLPAALLDKTLWISNLISSLLAAGWYWILPLLVYTSFAAIRARKDPARKMVLWLLVFSWVWIIICSSRAGGDQWDNPRYRTIFIPWLVLLAAWAWQHARLNHFYWLKHIWLAEGVFLLFFSQWYASRYHLMFGRMTFQNMVLTISVIWVVIFVYGLVMEKKQKALQ